MGCLAIRREWLLAGALALELGATAELAMTVMFDRGPVREAAQWSGQA